MTLYIDEILEQVMQKHREAMERNEELDDFFEWLNAKDINKDSLHKVLIRFSDEASHEIFESAKKGILDMDYVSRVIFTALGISFEIGYTSAEKQMDSKFDL